MGKSQPAPLPETEKPVDNEIASGKELIAYITARLSKSLAVAKAVGVDMHSLKFRIYGERVMWRLTCYYDPQMTRDEVRRIVWDLAVKGFGAYEPQFFKGDNNQEASVIACWFTDGASEMKHYIQF